MLTTQSASRKDERTGKADMQHRHFATVAAIIKGMPAAGFGAGVYKETAKHFADELASTNSRFDRKRFLAACGVA